MNALTQIDTSQPIAVFTPFRAELAALTESNATLVFDYEDPKGNKEARSHVHKLRQSASAVEKARKAAKADSLAYGRKVDAEAAEIDEAIRIMIAVHEKPLQEIEEREAARLAEIAGRIDSIRRDGSLSFAAGSTAINEAIQRVEAVEITVEAFGKQLPDATQAKDVALGQLNAALLAANTMEAEKDPE